MIIKKRQESFTYLPIPETYLTYELNQNEKLKFCIVYCLGALGIAFLFYHNILFSLLFFFVAYPCLKIYKEHLSDKRRK
ncbi:MAG: hypothetical protein AAGU75_01800, partial [Bacillota bacterium]